MSQTIVTIDVGGTGANTAAAARNNLGAVANTGGTITGNLTLSGATLNTATANISTIVTGNALTLSTGTGSNANIVFSANGTEYLRISNTGNVGIGTASPSLRSNGSPCLEIVNNSYTQLRVKSSLTSGGIEFTANNGYTYELQGSNVNEFFLYDRNATAYRIMVNSSGNIGIGTTAPRAKLDVDGAILTRYTSSTLGSKASGFICQSGSDITTAFGLVIQGGMYYQGSNDSSNQNFGVRKTTADGTLGAVTFNVNSSTGYMTNTSQVGFQATRGVGVGDQALGSDSTVLQFNETFYNVGSAYNTSTYRFTAPIAGRYLFAVTARLDGLTAGSYARVGLSINGNTGSFRYAMSISGNNHSTDYETQTVTAILNLAASDYVEAYGGRSGGGGGLQFESQFSGILLA